jgi:hypothetical protein
MAFPDADALHALPGLRIGLVVSLVEASRMDYQVSDSLRLVHLPVDDDDVPADLHLPLVGRLCAFMHRFRSGPGPANGVAIHCLHGPGRTGTLLACYRAYVAARYPSDRDGRPPTETATEIASRFKETYGGSVSGPSVGQLRWANRFYAVLRKTSDPDWERAATAELFWHKAPAEGDNREQAASWECVDCGAALFSNQETSSGPTWCLRCGHPTGNVEL